jgi:hypothetical protein
MSEEPSNSDSTEKRADSSVVRQLAGRLKNWLEDNNVEMHTHVEVALETAAQFADQGIDNAKSSIDMLREFAQNLKTIESFKVIPKQPMALEVDIRCKEEQDIEVKQPIAPFVELYALHFGRRINFEAQVNQTEKGLQLDIHEGMSFKILAPLIGIQTVTIKGRGLLKREDSGQFTLIVTTQVPGLDSPVTISVPIRHVFEGVQHLKKMKNAEQ